MHLPYKHKTEKYGCKFNHTILTILPIHTLITLPTLSQVWEAGEQGTGSGRF